MEDKSQLSIIDSDRNALTKYWAARDTRMMADREIINLVKPTAKTDQIKWISNEPKVFYDTAVSLMSSYAPRFRLPMDINKSAEEKDRMNKAERFLIGIYRSLDNRQMDIGEAYWLRTLAYWVCSGWWSVFTIVTKEDGEVKFIADILDPIHVYPEWNSRELTKCVRTYQTDRMTAIAMMEDFAYKTKRKEKFAEPQTDYVTVTNWWRKEQGKVYNAVVINGELMKPITAQKNMNRIPMHIGRVGVPDRITAGWVERSGENIIAANRDTYEYINVIDSLMATILAETAYPNIVTKTRTGQPALRAEDLKGYGAQISLKTDEAIELLKHASTPAEAQVLAGRLDMRRQQASLPNIVYGNVPIELSGFAISQLLAAIRYKLGAYMNAMQYTISRIMTDFLYQYKRGNFGKITLATEDPSDSKRGQTYIEEFSKEDIPDTIYVETTIPISSQFDKTQQILNSVQALQSGLLSRETLWETELDVQDTEAERERLRADMIFNDPVIRQIEMLEEMRQRSKYYRTQGMESAAQILDGYIALIESQLMTRNSSQQQPQIGVRSDQAPPETRNNPDVQRAATNTPPPRPNRPAGQSEGRKGILLRPSGEVIM